MVRWPSEYMHDDYSAISFLKERKGSEPLPVHAVFRNADVRGGIRPPARFETKGLRAQRKKNSVLLSTSTRDWGCNF